MGASHMSGPLFVGGIPIFGNAQASYFGRQWFVDTVNGSDGYDGKSPETAFATMGRAFYTDTITSGAGTTSNLGPNDTIWFKGTVRQQLIAPLTYNNPATGTAVAVTGVQIVGMAQGGVRDDDGAKWSYPASGATAGMASLALRQQGWVLKNFLMTPEPTSSACVELRRAEDAVNPDSSHAQFLGMRFVGIDITTTYGINDIGGTSNIRVQNCEFQLCTTGIRNAATPIAVPLRWNVIGNKFMDNTNHISMSSTNGSFLDNQFVTEATVNINLIAVGAQGATNVVSGNLFHNLAADITISDGWTGSATDQWAANQATDAVVYGVPA
jgi:hypothetical protein